jgi:hypothetical protein
VINREDVSPWLVGMFMALMGGALRGINCDRQDFTLWAFCQRVTAALFVGALATLILYGTDFDPQTKTAISGASGYVARDLLSALLPWVKKRLGL